MKSLLIFSITVVLMSSIVVSQLIQPENEIRTYIENSVPYIGTEIPRIDGIDGTGIKIAVIDTGVDFNHPDLFGWGPDGKVIGGYNFIEENELPMDTNGHGTKVAGIIAADGNTLGVAHKAKILAYKVSEDGEGVSSELIRKAIEKAIKDKADIINISLGVNKTNSKIDSAVNHAWDNGIFVVTAAGNDGPELKTIGSPGRNFESITVGATYNNMTSSLIATLEIDENQYTVIPMVGSSKTQEPIIEKIVFGFWSFILFIVFLDVVFEIIFGFNTLGFRSPITMPSRIASFFGDELVVGSFFLLFSLIFVTYFLKFYGHLLKTNTSIIFILIITSFLIGERSNFIKFFISISFIYFFILQINPKKKILVSVLLFIFLSLLLTFNSGAKYRYYDQIKSIYSKNGITNFLKKSNYGAHYDTAFKIFKNYPLFGIGIKNFRVESGTAKYRDGSYKSLDGSNYSLRWATHPHQIHFELLSETGIFGYLSFLLFIITSLFFSLKNYFKNKNLFQLSSIIYTVVFLIPLFPSGSFFSTFTSSLFWINYAIMMSYIKKP